MGNISIPLSLGMDLILRVDIITVNHIWLCLVGLGQVRLDHIWVEVVGLSYVWLVEPGGWAKLVLVNPQGQQIGRAHV